MTMNNAVKKKSLIGLIALVCAFTFFYWLYSRFYTSTDDAYVNANVVQMASRVTGQVQTIYVKNNQYVKAGELLFDLDPATFQIAVDQTKAQLDVNQANFSLAQATATRTEKLLKRRFASAQEADNTQASYQSALANVALAKANFSQAELNLRYTKIYAPASGWVTNVTLRVGDIVTANQPVFALVNDNEYWIDANFKETELAHLRVGEHAKIKVDMYPGHTFNGVLESISGGSGAAFSLLPPENATGNWVKVTQRVPVRIRVTDPDAKLPLRIGTSANVSIRVNPWKTHG